MPKKIIYKGKRPYTGRVYTDNGKQYVSVTSVLHPDGLDFDPYLLKQYASFGTIIHSAVEHFVKFRQIPKYEDIAEKEDLENVLNGSLKLDLDRVDIRGFFLEHGHKIKIKSLEKRIKNEEYGYMGRLDVHGWYKGTTAVMDWKTSRNYTPEKLQSYWMQQAAYAVTLDPVPELMVILPLNPKGYEDPIVCDEVDHYFELFKKKNAYLRANYEIPV